MPAESLPSPRQIALLRLASKGPISNWCDHYNAPAMAAIINRRLVTTPTPRGGLVTITAAGLAALAAHDAPKLRRYKATIADETAGFERHPVAAHIERHLDVAPANRERAVRLISALAFELETRGHTIQRSSPDAGELLITVGIQTVSCVCAEVMQLDDEFSRIGGANHLKSRRNGNLQLTVSGGRGGLRNTWADRPRGQAISKVGNLVDELELRSRLEIASRNAAAELLEIQDRAHAEALIGWARTLSVAQHEHHESVRRVAALEQAARADQAASLRRLHNALITNASSAGDELLAERNLRWATDVARYADEIDPTLAEATPLTTKTPWTTLAPYLDGRTPPAHPSTVRQLWGAHGA